MIDLGDLNVVVSETPGHTPHNISLFVPEDKVLFCGDTVVTEYIPNLECGNIDSWNIWLNSLDSLRKLNPKIVIPGHGDQISGTQAIGTAFNKIETILKKAIEIQKAPTLVGL